MKTTLPSDMSPFVVDVAPALQLVLCDFGDGNLNGTLYLGAFPLGTPILGNPFKAGDARISDDKKPLLYLGTVSYVLPPLELLKVADVLRLDYPLRHPVGGTVMDEQVPA